MANEQLLKEDAVNMKNCNSKVQSNKGIKFLKVKYYLKSTKIKEMFIRLYIYFLKA